MRRVVVTGMGGVCGLGASWPEIEAGLRARRNTMRRMHEWDRYTDMNTRLGGADRRLRAARALDAQTIAQHGPLLAIRRARRRTGVAGRRPARRSDHSQRRDGRRLRFVDGQSRRTSKAFAALVINNDASALNANSYVRMMPHTTAANIGIFFGAQGRIIPTSSACTSGSQGIGYAYEAIRYGQQSIMIAGGAEELCPTEAMAFDTLYATSRRNDAPHTLRRVPTIATATGSSSAKARRSSFSRTSSMRARRGARIHAELVGLRNEFRRCACHQAGGGDHARRDGDGACRRRRRDRRDRLCERSWHGHRAWRHRRDARDVRAVRSAHAAQFAEELSRSYARRVRRAGSVVHASR